MAIVDVKAEIGGVVWKVEMTVGAAVSEEDSIMTLESMKMEIPVLAPRSGMLAECLVSEGDIVSEGQVVARIAT